MPSLLSTALLVASIFGSANSLVIPVHDAPELDPMTIPDGIFFTGLPGATGTSVPTGTVGTGYPYPTSTGIPDPESPPNDKQGKIVTYFGQRGQKDETSLKAVCSDENVDIVALGFVNRWRSRKGDNLPGVNFAGFGHWEYLKDDKGEETDLLTVPEWEDEIQECQKKGKQVVISIGGAHVNEEVDGVEQDVMGKLNSKEEAEKFASDIWKLFGEGKGLEKLRPFGKAVVDGFDFDIENQQPKYVDQAMIALRKIMTGTEASKEYVITAAPQCPRPDKSLLDAVYQTDYLFIQFYNNEVCAGKNLVKSFNEWSADIKAKNPKTQLFVGVPGDATPASAGSGYLTPAELKTAVQQVNAIDNFGGLMVWESVGAMNNTDASGKNFFSAMRSALA